MDEKISGIHDFVDGHFDDIDEEVDEGGEDDNVQINVANIGFLNNWWYENGHDSGNESGSEDGYTGENKYEIKIHVCYTR